MISQGARRTRHLSCGETRRCSGLSRQDEPQAVTITCLQLASLTRCAEAWWVCLSEHRCLALKMFTSQALAFSLIGSLHLFVNVCPLSLPPSLYTSLPPSTAPPCFSPPLFFFSSSSLFSLLSPLSPFLRKQTSAPGVLTPSVGPREDQVRCFYSVLTSQRRSRLLAQASRRCLGTECKRWDGTGGGGGGGEGVVQGP